MFSVLYSLFSTVYYLLSALFHLLLQPTLATTINFLSLSDYGCKVDTVDV